MTMLPKEDKEMATRKVTKCKGTGFSVSNIAACHYRRTDFPHSWHLSYPVIKVVYKPY